MEQNEGTATQGIADGDLLGEAIEATHETAQRLITKGAPENAAYTAGAILATVGLLAVAADGIVAAIPQGMTNPFPVPPDAQTTQDGPNAAGPDAQVGPDPNAAQNGPQ
jgi:hypothetical protein